MPLIPKLFPLLSRTDHGPVLGVFFFAKKILGFLTFLAKILAIILGKVCKILQDFSRSWKELQDNFLKTKIIEDLGKKTKKVLNQSNTRSIDIL